MRTTANTSEGGRFCGRARAGISNLSAEDKRQIEAHRSKDRPTPWAHLAQRYGVNEVDLRHLFDPPANDDQPLPVAVKLEKPAPVKRDLTEARETLFRKLWSEGASKAVISNELGLSWSQVDRLRFKLRLPPRTDGSKPNGWSKAEDAYILRHYVVAGVPVAEVAKELPGRTEQSIIGRAYRKGWTRAHHPDVLP